MSVFTVDKFFARKIELDILTKKVESLKNGYRHNLAILGRRQIGKTSLLLRFLSILDKREIVPMYLDLSTLSLRGFLDQFVGMMLYHHYKPFNDNTEDDLELLLHAASSDLPKTRKKIKSIYLNAEEGKERSALQELFDLPTIFSGETGKFCIIILDNFRKLTEYSLKEPFSMLGEKIMMQKMSLYVLSDYLNADSKSILSEKLSLLFGKFQILELGSFDFNESISFIDLACRQPKLMVELKEFLAYFTDGNPFYLGALTEYITKKAADKRMLAISEKDFCAMLSSAIFDKFSPINLYFSRLLDKSAGNANFKNAVDVLNATIGKNKLTQIADASKCARKIVSKLLEKFIAQDIIIKNGPLYAIEDEIFKSWVRLKYAASGAQIKLGQKGYVDKYDIIIRSFIESFRKEREKGADNKILNLVAAFDNEKIAVNEKTHILPAFKHIRTEGVNSEDFLLTAHGSKLWVFSVFRRLADENSILGFINYCKSQGHRVSRKVLIVPGGITPEAKLMAMEERMWIWPIDKLNNLLNLYRKPKITL